MVAVEVIIVNEPSVLNIIANSSHSADLLVSVPPVFFLIFHFPTPRKVSLAAKT